MRMSALILICMAGLGLAACGQKGPLYLPNTGQASKAQH